MLLHKLQLKDHLISFEFTLHILPLLTFDPNVPKLIS